MFIVMEAVMKYRAGRHEGVAIMAGLMGLLVCLGPQAASAIDVKLSMDDAQKADAPRVHQEGHRHAEHGS